MVGVILRSDGEDLYIDSLPPRFETDIQENTYLCGHGIVSVS